VTASWKVIVTAPCGGGGGSKHLEIFSHRFFLSRLRYRIFCVRFTQNRYRFARYWAVNWRVVGDQTRPSVRDELEYDQSVLNGPELQLSPSTSTLNVQLATRHAVSRSLRSWRTRRLSAQKSCLVPWCIYTRRCGYRCSIRYSIGYGFVTWSRWLWCHYSRSQVTGQVHAFYAYSQ